MEAYDAQSKCLKCGYDVVRTEFHSRSFEEGACAVILCIFAGQDEHIVRTCVKCGFEFFQQPLSFKRAIEESMLIVQDSVLALRALDILPEESK